MASKCTVKIKNICIGQQNSIPIQSMCSIPFSRFEDLKKQALSLEQAGCDILRVAFPDKESAKPFAALKEVLQIPLVADIHFDWKLALEAISAGADKIRINPGNTDRTHLKQVVRAAEAAQIPIRVGINAGSMERDLLARYGGPTPEALAESAQRNVSLLEEHGFDQIVVSIKSSDVITMVQAYRLFAAQSPYPLHLGVTESGTLRSGTVKSSIGIGALLLDKIGDTLRVSLTADPLEEVQTAKILLRTLHLYSEGVEVISCPTCGRATTDTISLANRVEREFADVKTPLKIAVMGCMVNGPGEAKQADIGITGANGEYVLFCGDRILRHIPEDKIMQILREETEKIRKHDTTAD